MKCDERAGPDADGVDEGVDEIPADGQFMTGARERRGARACSMIDSRLQEVRVIILPLLALMHVSLLPAGIVLIVVGTRSRRAGVCRGCGYDQRGSTGTCGECGDPSPLARRPLRDRAWLSTVGMAMIALVVLADVLLAMMVALW